MTTSIDRSGDHVILERIVWVSEGLCPNCHRGLDPSRHPDFGWCAQCLHGFAVGGRGTTLGITETSLSPEQLAREAYWWRVPQ